MTEFYAERRLCAAVVHRAVADAQRGDAKAIAWLASGQAALWFDTLDMSQSALLLKSGWIDWASVALEDTTLPAPVRETIEETLDYLNHLN